MLLNAGADLTIENHGGSTAVMIAAQQNHREGLTFVVITHVSRLFTFLHIYVRDMRTQSCNIIPGCILVSSR